MSKKLIFIYLIIIFSIIFLTKCEEEIEESNIESEYDDGYGYDYFKDNLKQYLIQRKLFDSEEPVQKKELKEIFLDVITEGSEETLGDYFQKLFNELADYFVDSYFVNRKEIKGKEIYDLIDINQISEKFQQMVGDNPFNSDNYTDNENEDSNSIDEVGEATSDV